MRPLERIVALLPWCLSVCVSVCLSGTGVHCDHTVHVNVDLSLWFDSPMFWALWHQSMSTYSQPSFSSSTRKRGGVWMCKRDVISQERLKIEVKLMLSTNRKSYMPLRLIDLDWPYHGSASRAISAVAKLLVCYFTPPRKLCIWLSLLFCLSVCVSLCLFVCLSVCLSVCPSVCLSVPLFVCLSANRILKNVMHEFY